MAKNGLKRYIREAELFRRQLKLWQEIIENNEELHQVVVDPSLKEAIRKAVAGTKDTQQFILSYLRQSDSMFTKLDQMLGDFPTK